MANRLILFFMICATASARGEEKQVAAAERIAPAITRFEAGDSTIGDIVAAINAQGPNRLELVDPFETDRQPERRRPEDVAIRVRGEEFDGQTFWSAVQMIRVATRRRVTPDVDLKGPRRIILVPASGDRGFVSDDGICLMELTGAGYSRSRRFIHGKPLTEAAWPVDPPERDPGHYAVSLRLWVEPRFSISGTSSATVVFAVDDRSRLLTDEKAPSPPGRPEGTHADRASFHLRLRDPGAPRPKLIHRLEGFVDLEVTDLTTGAVQKTRANFAFTDVPLP
ncbi:MAG: hypothetical protein M3Y23_05170 [Actinomycetota bacterium]|nr:hypothetical protein [Actinomycetota bacterium]